MSYYHFCRNDFKTRYTNEDIKVGETLYYSGELKPCLNGLHACKRIIDALSYAPGTILCIVELGETVIQFQDKVVSNSRKVIAARDIITEIVKFAEWCEKRAKMHAEAGAVDATIANAAGAQYAAAAAYVAAAYAAAAYAAPAAYAAAAYAAPAAYASAAYAADTAYAAAAYAADTAYAAAATRAAANGATHAVATAPDAHFYVAHSYAFETNLQEEWLQEAISLSVYEGKIQ